MPAFLFHVGFEPAEHLWPTFVGVARGWSQTGVSHTDCGDTILFDEIKPDEGFYIVTLPAGVPGKFKQSRPVDPGILALTAERIPPRNTFHRPLAANAQVGIQLFRFVGAF